MKFSSTTIALVALAAVAATVRAWNMAPTFSFPPSPFILHKHMLHHPQQSQFTSPRYELVDNEEKFQLRIDVPGVKVEDIVVSLEKGFLTVRGYRVESDDISRFKSQFIQQFSLDPAILVDEFSVNLENGVLVVTAPKDEKQIHENSSKIPIMDKKQKLAGGTPGQDVKVGPKTEKNESVERLEEVEIGDIGD